MNLDRAMEYVSFVTERHRIWERRQAGQEAPWTTDPVLASKKFTCVFRVLDHDSQWLLTNLLEGDPRDVLMRCFLFRHTGRVAAWERVLAELGGPPTVDDLEDVREVFKEYRGKTTVKLKNRTPGPAATGRWVGGFQAQSSERPLFTSAYLVFPQSQVRGTDKLDSIIDLTKRLFCADLVMPDFLAARTQAERFATMKRNPGVGDFMSMQVLTDWGYTTEDRENEFIVLGPGARRGIREVFGRENVADLEAARGMLGDAVPRLPNGREPSLMDLQNTFCEFSKAVRGPGRKPYTPAHPGPQPPPKLPRNWG